MYRFLQDSFQRVVDLHHGSGTAKSLEFGPLDSGILRSSFRESSLGICATAQCISGTDNLPKGFNVLVLWYTEACRPDASELRSGIWIILDKPGTKPLYRLKRPPSQFAKPLVTPCSVLK